MAMNIPEDVSSRIVNYCHETSEKYSELMQCRAPSESLGRQPCSEKEQLCLWEGLSCLGGAARKELGQRHYRDHCPDQLIRDPLLYLEG